MGGEINQGSFSSGFRDDHEKSLSDLCSDRPFVCPEKQEKYV